MSKKILVATDKPFAAEAAQLIRQAAKDAGYPIAFLEKYTDVSEFHQAVTDAEALIVRSDLVTPEVIEHGKQLKIVVRAGAGFDNIDLKAASAKSIVVMNTPGQNSNAVAELAIGMMIYQARGKFNGKSGTEIHGKTLGIHAYGNVGRLVAKYALGFGMKVYAFDPFVSDEAIKADGVIPVKTREELYKTCQYVSLHIPATAETKKSINFDLLSTMPQNAVLVNTARKEVVCEEGLKKLFAERKDFQYVSDVAPDCLEDLNQEYAARIYATPKKMGAQTEEANINAGVAAVKQIVAFFETGDTTFQVNK